MNLVVISPEGDDPREQDLLPQLIAAGLSRYHLRKPTWSAEKLEAWLLRLAPTDRRHVVVHQHHPLVDKLSLGGRHWRDGESAPDAPRLRRDLTSRSCHDARQLRVALGCYDAILFSPLFSSLSKPGYGPGPTLLSEVKRVLEQRTADERRTAVLALGGITPDRIPTCRELGFDGVACLGYVWQSADPVQAYRELQSVLVAHAA